jgi:hypothetical protein
MYNGLERNQWKNIAGSTPQEEFVLNVLKEKRNGFFLELGSHHPQIQNNTYNLEKKYGWNGLALEIQTEYVRMYNEKRSAKCLMANALSFDYRKYFLENGFPKQIDYLQIDVDDTPRYANLKALINIPLFDYRFSVITIEHDVVRDFTLSDMRKTQRLILNSFDYDLVVQERGEDWWVDKKSVDYKNYWDLFRMN